MALVGLRVVAPHFVAGLTLRDGKVIEAAPILKYMMGWELMRVVNYCRHKRWSV